MLETNLAAQNRFRDQDRVSVRPWSSWSALPKVFDDFGIHTILDIPCGDFHWMKHVSLDSINYTGADIVADLIQKNKQKYATGEYQVPKTKSD